ncbi:hypothetical protein ACJX0J_017030, partial [Zea mays]
MTLGPQPKQSNLVAMLRFSITLEDLMEETWVGSSTTNEEKYHVFILKFLAIYLFFFKFIATQKNILHFLSEGRIFFLFSSTNFAMSCTIHGGPLVIYASKGSSEL